MPEFGPGDGPGVVAGGSGVCPDYESMLPLRGWRSAGVEHHEEVEKVAVEGIHESAAE